MFLKESGTYTGLVLLMLINPMQLPLHEPYFDLTPIRIAHTKNPIKKPESYYSLD